MTERDLQALLRELDQELEKHQSVDDATRALVADVRADLDRVLAAPAPEVEADESLRERLAKALNEFERDHPQLVEATQRVLDQLANLGV